MVTPFDDFPIHPSADPITHPATGDPDHYDRCWFNGQDTSSPCPTGLCRSGDDSSILRHHLSRKSLRGAWQVDR